MPRGDHPNSRENLKKGRPFDAETARKAKVESDKAKAINKSLNEDLKERCTPERIGQINERLISMDRHIERGTNELLRDGLGEKPGNKVELSTRQADIEKMDNILEMLGMTDGEAGEIT